MDAHRCPLGFDHDARRVCLGERRYRIGGALQWLKVWLRRLDDPRAAGVPLLQSVVTNKERARQRYAADQEVGVPAADDDDVLKAMAELAEKRHRLRIGRRLLRFRHDRCERAIEVEAEEDARGRNA
jgi:hypothetical protein